MAYFEEFDQIVYGVQCGDLAPVDCKIALESVIEDLRGAADDRRDIEAELSDRTEQFDDYRADLADHLGGVGSAKWKAWIEYRKKSRWVPAKYDYWHDEDLT